MAEELLSRKDVPEELKWDLTLIYKDDDTAFAELKRMEDIKDHIVSAYKGKLTDARTINECLKEYQEVERIVYLVTSYTSLAVEVDYYDVANQEKNAKVNNRVVAAFSELSFIQSELLENSEEVLKEAIELGKTCGNAGYLEDVLRGKAHTLSKEVEKALATISQSQSVPYEIYNIAKLADMKFDDFTANGKNYALGYSLFEDDYEYESDTDVRRAAFAAFSEKIKQYENVTAGAYNAQVRNEKAMSELRGYKNVFEYLLFDQKVDMDLYNRQIDLITEKLAPHMRKYAKLLQKIHKLDKMTYADLKLTVDPTYSPAVTIEESKEYVLKGLSILGEEYGEMIKTAYKDRWVDFAQNQGKCTGGFCASPYGVGSFILLSWNGRMSDVFTLAHELGHAGHFRLCNKAQSIFDTNVSGYFVEAPSTMNELLMAHYLLKTNEDKRFRRWVLANMISNTYYHNFVTHLLEAAYQREVYKIIDEGGCVQAETLNGIFKDVLTKFWGDDVELTEGAELTWMRQPHYYMGLYSYTYSAGLTVATQVCKRIENEGQVAVDDWKKVLAAGSTLPPVGLAKLAGIDITTDKPLLDTIEYIGSVIDEICELTEELGF